MPSFFQEFVGLCDQLRDIILRDNSFHSVVSLDSLVKGIEEPAEESLQHEPPVPPCLEASSSALSHGDRFVSRVYEERGFSAQPIRLGNKGAANTDPVLQ